MGGRRVKKTLQEGSGEGKDPIAAVQALYAEFKELSWWVESRLAVDGRTSRSTGTLSVFQQDAGVKVCIRDRAERRVAFVWGRGFVEALQAAERALASDTLDWRQDRFAQG